MVYDMIAAMSVEYRASTKGKEGETGSKPIWD